MSKKSKRLEKENMQLTRKQEATNKNIFAMAEERSQSQQLIERLQRENEKLKKLCRAMQTNGYGRADLRGAAGEPTGPGDEEQEEEEEEHIVGEEEDGLEETDSEYDEYDEDEEGSVEGEYDEDTEEEPIDVRPRTYGPPPPPPPTNTQQQQQPQQQQQASKSLPIRTEAAVNGVNGARH